MVERYITFNGQLIDLSRITRVDMEYFDFTLKIHSWTFVPPFRKTAWNTYTSGLYLKNDYDALMEKWREWKNR